MIEIIKDRKKYFDEEILKIENNKELDSDEMIKNIEEIKKIQTDFESILKQLMIWVFLEILHLK